MTSTTTAPKSSAEILEQLMSGVDEATTRMKTRDNPEADVGQVLAGLETELKQTETETEPAKRDTRRQIIQATFDSLRANIETEGNDLAKAMTNLHLLFESLGVQYKDLQKMSPEEEAMIAKAKRAVTEAEANLAAAQTKMFFRAKAIKSAEAELNMAKGRLTETESKVQSMMRDRLMHASIEDSLNTFKIAHAKCIQSIVARREETAKQLKAVRAQREKATQTQEKAAQFRNELDGKIDQATDKLREAEEARNALENGSPEYVQKDRAVADLRVEIEALTGKRNAALALYEDKKIFSERLREHETVQSKLYNSQTTWLTLLQSQMEERLVTLRSWLDAMKSAADTEVAKNIHDMGRRIDKDSDGIMAQIAVATDEAIVKTFENYPDWEKALEETLAALNEKDIEHRGRMAKALDDIRSGLGIDRSRTSFFKQEAPAA